jgi:hypothetical protein
MRLTEAERGLHYRMREVTDLRIQFLCEYRLQLKQEVGDIRTEASVVGMNLHQHVSMLAVKQSQTKRTNRFIPLLIFILTLIFGFLWIFR